jgi:hypothetical protein
VAWNCRRVAPGRATSNTGDCSPIDQAPGFWTSGWIVYREATTLRVRVLFR